MSRMRLDKMLAMLAVCPRSGAKSLLRTGRVRVGGKHCADPGFLLDPNEMPVTLDGVMLEWKDQRTVMLNKPAGVLTAARDPRQPTVMDLLPPLYRAMGAMPAGRLDKDTEGLLILTSDGQLAHRLISPKKEIGKLYEAQLDAPVIEEDIPAFRAGLAIADADGAFTARPALLLPLPEGRARVWVTEGKYHQVRRMFAARGKRVLALKRLQIGSLPLDPALSPAAYRELTDTEIDLLETPPEAILRLS